MAVKSKTQIITDINNKITAGGNIKAIDTNAILKDILDCRELNEQGSNLPVFAFQSVAPIITDGGMLNYSLRGIIDSFVNITFRIDILANGANNLKFVHGDVKITEALKSIILDPNTGIEIDFLVKIKRRSNPTSNNSFIFGNLNFTYGDKEFVIRIEPQSRENNIVKGDQIFTSFAIHCPRFNAGS